MLSGRSERSCFKVAASMRITALSSGINRHWLINVSVISMLRCFVLRARLPRVTAISRVRLRIVILTAILLFLLVIALSMTITTISTTGSSFSRARHLSRVLVLEV